MPRRVRVGAYIRVSRVMGRAGERFLSPDIQIAEIRRWANHQYGESGWTLIETFRDLDVSGVAMDRAELNRARAMAEAGQLDVIAFYDLSRWARCVADGLAVLQEVEGFGVKVASASESIDMTTGEGEFQVTLLLAVHQLRARQAAKSWRETIARQGEQGRHHGKPPLGYAKENGRLIPHSETAPIVREVFERFVAGEPAIRIEDDLHGLGLPLMRVSRIVSNPVYIGKVLRREHEGNAVRQEHKRDPETLTPYTRRKAKASRHEFREGDGVKWYDGQHEPLIDMGIWGRAQQRLDAARRSNTREWKDGPRHALAKVAVCDACGYALIRQIDKRRDNVETLRDVNGRRAERCPGVGQVFIADLEAFVRDELVRLADLWEFDLAAARSSTQKIIRDTETKIAKLEGKVTQADAKLVDLLLNRDDVVGGDKVYQAAASKVEAQRETYLSEIENLRESMPTLPSAEGVKALRTVAKSWDRLTVEERNRLLRKWITQVRVARPSYHGQPVAERAVVVP